MMALKSNAPTRAFIQQVLVKEWLESCHKGELLSALKQHWKCYVLVVLGHGYDPAKEDRLAEKFLFRPMEYFLCNGDPEVKFKELKEKDCPAQLCGKVFKYGEPTYSCRDCANDPTCVLCIDCFQKSAHKKHRYKMSTSGGGGYCDCGDSEAWKTAPFCSNHKAKQQETSGGENPMEKLPDELTDRASALLMAVLRYTMEMLTWDQCDNLPPDLQPEGELEDSYITMLFNDEVHTYEQVIVALQRAVDCTQKEAVEFATTVDREGRSNVRSGNFSSCEKARNVIEHNTSRHGNKPLKVQVMHTIVVAHQAFALKVIQWLQTIIAKSDGLRHLFCVLSMQPQEDGQSIMEKLLLIDTQLWKVARVNNHQLIMAGVLMDLECKKQFAILFTKHYATLVRDFIRDDHYRSVSITSLSVQIFTVPTLARMLVTEHNLLDVIMQSFLKCCEEKKNNEGKLAFDRGDRNQAFKRACYMLYDMKYALTCKPSEEEWTDKLRENFLKGLRSFLSLLKMMQSMDAVIRQTGTHLEYEPEWEGAFNLQLKQDDIIAEFINWCGQDKETLIGAYKITMEILSQCKDKPATVKHKFKTVAGFKAKCVQYDVSSQHVSIHLPLTRFMAGLHLHLEKHGLNFNSPELAMDSLTPVDLIEPPLRVLVMIAQTQANMWRRNGYGLLNQIFFYHNVKCRREMYDKDIVMLQVGASVIDSNEFLIHLLNKFNLLAWANPEYDVPGSQEDMIKQTVTLAEEFLNILIIIIGERYVEGIGNVTSEDTVQREIIHQLCISPMAHSELSKALPEDSNHETGIEQVIDQVSTFKKSASNSSGRFELKKESYQEYSKYFYHYSRAEQSKSEEAQIERKKHENEGQALPPPVPQEFKQNFQPITNLLQCDLMLYLMHLLLQRTAAKRSRSWSEGQLDRILYIIGLALLEQRRAITEGDNSFNFLSKALDDEKNIMSIMEGLVGSANLTHESTKDLLTWTLKLFLEVRKMKNDPVSMDTLDQLSSCTNQNHDETKKLKAKMAAKRRAKIMAQMSTMQKNFIKENAELFQSAEAELSRTSSDMDISDLQSGGFPVALGKKRSKVVSPVPCKGMCILCQEEQEIKHSGRAMVLAAFVQRSTVLSQCRSKVISKEDNHDYLFSPSDLTTGTYTSSCGHVMHFDCWQRFFDAVVMKERRRPIRFRSNLSYNIDQNEFLCPLCESISNTVIPVVPSLPSLIQDSNKDNVNLTFNDWLDGLHKSVQSSRKDKEDKEAKDMVAYEFEPSPLHAITKMMAESVAINFKLLWQTFQNDSTLFAQSLTDMVKKFGRDVYSFGLNVEPDDGNVRVPLIAWSSCAFTLQSIEQQLNMEEKPLFGSLSSRQSDCLASLIKFACVFSQVIPQDLVKQHCLRLLSALMPEKEKKRKDGQSLLDIDMFDYLLTLTVTLPSLYADSRVPSMSSIPTGGLGDHHTLQLVLTAHIVQIMLTCDIPSQGMMEIEADSEGEALLRIYTHIRKEAKMEGENQPQPWQLSQYLRKACLPFLRCAALLYRQITEVPAPSSLQELEDDEFEPLCRYLALPQHLSTLFESQGDIINSLVKQWCHNDNIGSQMMTASSEKVVCYPLKVNRLVTLPEDYSELINEVSSFTCPKSDGDESRAPTMCLVCGKMLCSQSYCCQADVDGTTCGAATEHTVSCGAGIGIFLRVRECQILLLAGKSKGCFVPSPYLDVYGETDQGLRRGNPLTLCRTSYKALEKLWFTHSIPETIAHNLESHSNLLTIDWQHL
ncbi:E3 ubiquitin-protein ligase UBR2-like isoform X2 [Mizuhopecten yessoensis]|uniref:E3 ubiquitin-protein ligase UBR2-like isoform X2 n=1 Tax=Mizuhopecten yessoensis TaxID=6573 RepID=UPI000B458E07|nr:E3 ubiquitin-protein ligase UBR2-like isoform X2 [Mizuhopecten yessoensis]